MEQALNLTIEELAKELTHEKIAKYVILNESVQKSERIRELEEKVKQLEQDLENLKQTKENIGHDVEENG